MEQLNNIKIRKMKPLNDLKDFSIKAATEGIVMLKNDNQVLPLIDKTISIFGRMQFDYYKSGTGSGGLVNVNHVTNILEGIRQNPKLKINEELLEIYTKWVKDNPFDMGSGLWASEPWSQVEMPINEADVKNAALKTDVAVIILGRTAGEDKDNSAQEGSYYLRKDEKDLIEKVTKYFNKVVLVLNVGNIIDMSMLDEYNISSVLYVWHGGQEGGIAVADILSGNTNPSGKLADTIAYNINDYPSTKYFGEKDFNCYVEDIYVGYRYFETFAKDKVRFPFGYGLSYTKFEINVLDILQKDNYIDFKINVKNIGDYNGKEVVQIYFEAPQGKLGKPLRQLSAFTKTKLLCPNEATILKLSIDINKCASYDDVGYISKSAYVLESGQYNFYIGNNVRDSYKIYSYNILKDIVVEQLQQALAPVHSFERFKPTDNLEIEFEKVPTKEFDLQERMNKDIPAEYKIKDNQKYKLIDVYNKKISMENFVAQLDNEQLACIVRGEGMSSPKVTGGTAAAFGGVTDELLEYGIPVVCASDGPSGIRMDSGMLATSMPNGTCLASTFNYELIKELYFLEGIEMNSFDIDTLLCPGMNIHRNPLNGRNFEYFSEDPLLTGIMGQAVTEGLHSAGVSGSLKHFACNNQELNRHHVDSIVSERALREIYLKGFEIAVKAGNSRTIMTAYNPINGIWTASNYDLNTTISRNEWGFKGIIMTDWWAEMNDEGMHGLKNNSKAMIRSQNDIYMVTPNSKENTNKDNTIESLKNNTLQRSELQRCAKNICEYIILTKTFRKSNFLLEEKNVSKEPWFKVENEKIVYPSIDKIFINKKELELSKYKNIYYIQKEKTKAIIDFTTNDKVEVIKKNYSDITILKVKNEFDETIYRILELDSDLKKYENIIIDTKSFEVDYCHSFINNVIELKFDKYCYKTSNIKVENNSLLNCIKDEIITFAIDVIETTSYNIEIDVICNVSELSQVPYSIIIDNDNALTLTSGTTRGNTNTMKANIIIEKGLKFFSLRFARTGLEVKKIRIIK